MLYRLLKIVVGIGIRFYYKEIKIAQRKNLLDSGPCLLLANHPNTLMDAWIVGFISKRPIYFMAKATFFNSPLKLRILKSLNMIPINRQGEGKMDGVNNASSFEACYQLLEEGKCLVIFPEGTSYLERHLRELKTGAARIVLETEKRNHGKLKVKVIPLGLNYLEANRFRSSILVNVGAPIEVVDFLPEYEEKPSQGAKRLTETFRIRMEQLLAYSDEKSMELLIEELHTIFSSKYIKSTEKGVSGEVNQLKAIRDSLTEIELTAPWKLEEIKNLLTQLKWQIGKFEIRADFLDRRFRSKMFLRQLIVSLVFLIIGLPLFVFGVFHNVFQYKLTDFLVPKITKELEYYAPIAVLIGLVTYPLCYLGFLMLGKNLFELTAWEQAFYFLAMPISGMYAYSFSKYLKHIAFKWKFIFLMINNKQTILELQEKKNKLRSLLFD